MRSDDKLTSGEILDGICEEIRKQLAKNDVFGNDSLCYSGAKFNFGIQLELYSRGTQKLETAFDRTVGEPLPGDAVEKIEESGERVAKRRGWPAGKPRKPVTPPPPSPAVDGHTL